jgi:dTDP-L-rhamnose 4-epimerase
MRNGQWEIHDAHGEALEPVPTPETKSPALASVYALSKYDQEIMTLVTGRAYNIPAVALRFFNVYGERQALSNPYTGVLAIFASRLLNNNPPLIYEDGLQRRDFVSVHDVADACLLALEQPAAAGEVFNIGSGESVSVLEIAARVATALGRDIPPEITRTYRAGDIRHCFSDISKARTLLGFTPRVALEPGITRLAQWLATQAAEDRAHQAVEELKTRGLAR